jgi:hypothetical protein
MGAAPSFPSLAASAVGANRPPPVPIATLPIQRVPTRDGASGLHYSGRVYSNEFNASSTDLCNGAAVSPDKINDIMPKSISSPTLPIDPSTKRIDAGQLASYVKGLEAQGLVPGKQPSFDKQMTMDSTFYTAVQQEYCFYESRYTAALKQFLTLVSAPQATDSGAMLQATVTLNKRLNSLLEIMNYVANSRAKSVNDRAPQITGANEKLQEKLAQLAAQKEFLQNSDVRIRTQEEMMRYSAEKSRAMNIQIVFFVALNVVALGTIITVYKSIGTPRT